MRKLIIFIACAAMFTACTPSRAFEARVKIVPGDQGPGFSQEMTTVLGDRGTIEVINELPVAHGFSIPELDVQEVVQPNEIIQVEVSGVEPVDYQYLCQLHDVVSGKGKHRRGTLRAAF